MSTDTSPRIATQAIPFRKEAIMAATALFCTACTAEQEANEAAFALRQQVSAQFGSPLDAPADEPLVIAWRAALVATPKRDRVGRVIGCECDMLSRRLVQFA